VWDELGEHPRCEPSGFLSFRFPAFRFSPFPSHLREELRRPGNLRITLRTSSPAAFRFPPSRRSRC
jgi:hypothetical protein